MPHFITVPVSIASRETAEIIVTTDNPLYLGFCNLYIAFPCITDM